MPDGIITPYLSVAMFCENVLEEKDNVLSAIRIVDRLYVDPDALAEVDAKSPPHVQIVLLLKFISVGYSGTPTLHVKSVAPNGKESELFGATPLPFSLEKTGIQVRVNVAIAIKHGGWYWVDVYLDGEVARRVPLQIVLQKAGSEQQ